MVKKWNATYYEWYATEMIEMALIIDAIFDSLPHLHHPISR